MRRRMRKKTANILGNGSHERWRNVVSTSIPYDTPGYKHQWLVPVA